MLRKLLQQVFGWTVCHDTYWGSFRPTVAWKILSMSSAYPLSTPFPAWSLLENPVCIFWHVWPAMFGLIHFLLTSSTKLLQRCYLYLCNNSSAILRQGNLSNRTHPPRLDVSFPPINTRCWQNSCSTWIKCRSIWTQTFIKSICRTQSSRPTALMLGSNPLLLNPSSFRLSIQKCAMELMHWPQFEFRCLIPEPILTGVASAVPILRHFLLL